MKTVLIVLLVLCMLSVGCQRMTMPDGRKQLVLNTELLETAVLLVNSAVSTVATTAECLNVIEANQDPCTVPIE